MSDLSKFMTAKLGPSWKTTVLGMAAAAAQAGGAFILTNAFPGMSDSNKLEVWGIALASAIITAVKGYYTKDKDVSNALTPVQAAKVPAEAPKNPNVQ